MTGVRNRCRVSGVRCQVSVTMRCQVSVARCQGSDISVTYKGVLGVRCQESDVWYQMPVGRGWVSGVWCQMSGVRCQDVSGVRCQVSGVRFELSGVRKCQV